MGKKSKERKTHRSSGGPAVPDVVHEEQVWDSHVDHTLDELNRLYTERVVPVEEAYEYNIFRPSWFAETVKQKKPFVTFLGPFSSGKSTFINYLMQSEHLLTGPQPLTDKFTIIMFGEKLQTIPGRVLLADPNLPFRALSQFGDTFAENFTGLLAPHPILRSVSFIDTPGVLEAAGDVRSRRYDYVKVVRWFAEKSDLLFFLFDPTKLDAGAELRCIFTEALKGLESKIRIVLNKADTVKPQELLRVYGALFWNLSGLIRSTEPPRVYVSSFWQRPYQPGTDHELFRKEKDDLLYELIETVPLQSLDRRVTSVMRRATDVMIWALLCATYRTHIPAVFGKAKAKTNFYVQYAEVVKELAGRYRLSESDFPSVSEVRTHLSRVASHKYPDTEKLTKKRWIAGIQQSLQTNLPALLGPIKQHAVVDPLDRKRAIAALRDYSAQQVGNNRSGSTRGDDNTASSLATSPLPPMHQHQQQQQHPQMYAMMAQMVALQQQNGTSSTGNDSSALPALQWNQSTTSSNGYNDSSSGGQLPSAAAVNQFSQLSPEQQQQLLRSWSAAQNQ